AAARRNREVVGIDQPRSGLAVCGQGGDLGAAGNVHRIAAGLDRAAVAALWGRGVELARDIGGAAVGDQLDRAGLGRTLFAGAAGEGGHGARLDDAGIVDLG